ncbi:DoxX family protein [Streptomyces actuosus]|uniref:DoxX family protein n=1 Tax=Streptomyces actuosus TaxID=1885 RepID=A0ABS2VHL9_STRAS|nr:DoxX family protein [Streptomyces actuosus]MBN0042586.1 DoxX family protein [Streptomyces actuosus]
MSLMRLAGRPMLASMFIAGGMESVRRPERVAPAAEPVVRPIAARAPLVPSSIEQAVRLSGAVQVVSGVMLSTGRIPRVAALTMAGTLVPTTLAGHRFWEAEDPAERARQRVHFLKNASVFGGLLIAAADTAGAPSLVWRGRQASRDLRHDVRLVGRTVLATARTAAALRRVRGRLPF